MHFSRGPILSTGLMFAAAAFFICASSTANATSGSIIIQPEPPSNGIELTKSSFSNFQVLPNAIGSNMRSNLQTLQTTLETLSVLDTPENQKALDDMGLAYANLPALGSNLSAAIRSADAPSIVKNGSALGDKLPKLLADFNDGEIAMNAAIGPDPEKMKQAKASQAPKEGMKKLVDDGTISPQFMKTQGKMMGLMFHLLSVNNQLSSLNANLTSVAKTYQNLIALSKQPPSVLLNAPDLGHQLGVINGLATVQFGNIAIGGELADMNENIDAFSQAGGFKSIGKPEGTALTALDGFDKSLNGLSRHIFPANNAMGLRLGLNGTTQSFLPVDADSPPPTYTMPATNSAEPSNSDSTQ